MSDGGRDSRWVVWHHPSSARSRSHLRSSMVPNTGLVGAPERPAGPRFARRYRCPMSDTDLPQFDGIAWRPLMPDDAEAMADLHNACFEVDRTHLMTPGEMSDEFERFGEHTETDSIGLSTAEGELLAFVCAYDHTRGGSKHKRRPNATKPRRCRGFNPWSGAGSNCRPLVFQTSALPTELPDHGARAEARAMVGGSDGI